MAKVLYKRGTKATYLGLATHDSNALYFCTDTRELFNGDDLYTAGARLVESFADLPAFEKAAEGIIYFCKNDNCGYLLNENRDGWERIVNGVDGKTIDINTEGLAYVKAVPIDLVEGLAERLEAIEKRPISAVEIATLTSAGIVKPSEEIQVAEDGTMSIGAIEPVKIIGLTDRLEAIESAIIGGVRYCGSVETIEMLPADAKQGDLYEVAADGSEWCFNGEKWFEYGSGGKQQVCEVSKKELYTVSNIVKYEVPNKPIGTLVNYYEKEIRVMCPADTEWELQQSGENADPNAYYIGFKAYAPSDDIVSFKEDLGEIISDPTMYNFEGEFAGIDEFGRKYSIVWLPVASYSADTDTWTYFGGNSSKDKCVGWYYSVEWYNTDGVKVAADTIRINLTNENCHTSSVPYYVAELQNRMETIEDGYTWEDM